VTSALNSLDKGTRTYTSASLQDAGWKIALATWVGLTFMILATIGLTIEWFVDKYEVRERKPKVQQPAPAHQAQPPAQPPRPKPNPGSGPKPPPPLPPTPPKPRPPVPPSDPTPSPNGPGSDDPGPFSGGAALPIPTPPIRRMADAAA
jgi:hypothetical protein